MCKDECSFFDNVRYFNIESRPFKKLSNLTKYFSIYSRVAMRTNAILATKYYAMNAFFSFFPTIVIPNTDTMQIDKTWLKVETFVEQKYNAHVQINFVCMIEIMKYP